MKPPRAPARSTHSTSKLFPPPRWGRIKVGVRPVVFTLPALPPLCGIFDGAEHSGERE